MAWYYTFEAKEIQGFILQSDKLREMVGGSEIVARLCGAFLKDALASIGISEPNKVIIANAAGWARMCFEDEKQAREFARYWPLLVSRFAPGLKLIQACFAITSSLPEAVNKGMEELRGKRNLNEVNLPEIGPLIERNPRTGAAAMYMPFDKKAKKPVPIDQQAKCKRKNAGVGTLIGKITRDDKTAADIPIYAWPYEIEEIASDKSAYVAVIHADGNDLGSTLMQIGEYLKGVPDEAEAVYRELTQIIDKITVAAVRAAADRTLFADYRKQLERGNNKPKIAARPIVLGGDDLTIIVRADMAVDFTAEFLTAFERNSKVLLAGLQQKIKGLPEVLTACAGIAFVKKSYPFSAAYHMAESLCDHTKKGAKKDRDIRKYGHCGHVPVPSSFTFYRVNTSMAEGFGEVKSQELTGRGLFTRNKENMNETEPVKFWLGPYSVGNVGGNLPNYDSLNTLMDALVEMPTGSIRTLITTMHTDPVTARNDYYRILEVANKKQGDALQKGLSGLIKNQDSPLWNNDMQTPLADAYLLCEIRKGGINA